MSKTIPKLTGEQNMHFDDVDLNPPYLKNQSSRYHHLSS